jgi:N-acetylneuraminic acid mutarotase
MEPSLPAAIEETGAAVAGGKLYVMGGFDAAGRSLTSVYVYDGTSWQGGPTLPLAVDHPSAASLDGNVYLSGGHSFGRTSAQLIRFDGASWSSLASMRYARGGHTLLTAQGRLYAMGGNNAAGNVGPAEVYDPSSNAWSTLPSMPVPRNHVSGFVIGSDVCIAGGRAPTTARVDCFDTAQGAWHQLPDLPRATSGAGATAFIGGGVVIMGGQNAQETAIVDQLTRYTASSGWSTGDAMMVPRHGFELAVFQDRAWACGGGTAPGLRPVATCTSVANPTPLRRP